MGNILSIINNNLSMKLVQATIAIAAFILGAEAVKKGYPDHLGEMFPNKESMYGNDCDIYESENWLGTGKCKSSWECRGARMCEGQGWCYGDDACEEVHE